MSEHYDVKGFKHGSKNSADFSNGLYLAEERKRHSEMQQLAHDNIEISKEIALHAEEAAFQAQRQTESIERHNKFLQNVMRLEVADDFEKIKFFKKYDVHQQAFKNEINAFIENLSSKIFGEIKDNQANDELIRAKEELVPFGASQDNFEAKDASVAEAKINYKKEESKYQMGIAYIVLILFFILLNYSKGDETLYILMVGLVVAIFYTFFKYRHWSLEKKPYLSKKLLILEDEKKILHDAFIKEAEKFNSSINYKAKDWNEKISPVIFSSYIDNLNIKDYYLINLRLIVRGEEDFPATCRTTFASNALHDLDHEFWGAPQKYFNNFNGKQLVFNSVKNKLIHHYDLSNFSSVFVSSDVIDV